MRHSFCPTWQVFRQIFPLQSVPRRQTAAACRGAVRANGTLSSHTPGLTPLVKQRNMAIKEQNFDYFLVLDFEATCVENSRIDPQEVIEFPILKVSGKTFQTEAQFHQYVRPEVHPELSPFCTQLTGIIQEQVDGQPDFKTTLQSVDDWMRAERLLEPGVRSVFVTCGDWDLKTMLPHQCQCLGITPPPYFSRWINIKKPFSDVTGSFPKGIMPMLQGLGLSHQGRLHSGIDDCLNISSILKGMAERGYVFRATGHL